MILGMPAWAKSAICELSSCGRQQGESAGARLKLLFNYCDRLRIIARR
jgi:hypothetical protein